MKPGLNCLAPFRLAWAIEWDTGTSYQSWGFSFVFSVAVIKIPCQKQLKGEGLLWLPVWGSDLSMQRNPWEVLEVGDFMLLPSINREQQMPVLASRPPFYPAQHPS